MYTQCPHCQTLFRISSEQLRTAAGKARCCQCNQVFNALAGLREELNESKTEDLDDLAEGLLNDTLNLDATQLYEPSDESLLEVSSEESSESVFWEQNDGLESEPAYLAMGSESQMSDLLDRDSATAHSTLDDISPEGNIIQFKEREPASDLQLDAAVESATDDSERLTAMAAEQLADDMESADKRAPTENDSSDGSDPKGEFAINEMFRKGPASWTNILWGIGGLLMFALLGIQIIWHFRDRVVQTHFGDQFLQTFCQVANCQAPQRRDLGKIEIEHRDLRAHPEQSGALLLQLGMINRADYDQPYPRIQLSLYNDNQKLIAQRIFEPREYLSDDQKSGLMLSRRTVNISMELIDPGREVTGFKFEFL